MKNKNLLKFITISFFLIFIFSVPIITLFTEDKKISEIENKILNHEIYQKVKDYSKTKEKVKTYLEVGELLKNVDTKYGKNVIKDYSKRLTYKFGKKYTASLLYKIKQFYNIIEKVPTLSGKLTWSHKNVTILFII